MAGQYHEPYDALSKKTKEFHFISQGATFREIRGERRVTMIKE